MASRPGSRRSMEPAVSAAVSARAIEIPTRAMAAMVSFFMPGILLLSSRSSKSHLSPCYTRPMRISTKFTYEDLEAIRPDRNRYEIVDGELIVTAAPIPLHQRILGNLFGLIWTHVRQHRLVEVYQAPLDIVFSPGTVLEPDLIFIR